MMACSLSNMAAYSPFTAPGRETCGVFAGNIFPVVSVPFLRTVTKPFVNNSGVVIASSSKNGQSMVQVDQNKEKRPTPTRGRSRDESPLGLLDAWDPFSAGSLSQMIDTMDRLFDASFNAASPGSLRSGVRTPWDVFEDEERFHLRVDMPGFGKEDVKVSIEDQVLLIKAERQSEEGGNYKWASRSIGEFNTQVALPENVVLEQIKAEMKNGVLSVTVPKVKTEEKKSVMDVKVL